MGIVVLGFGGLVLGLVGLLATAWARPQPWLQRLLLVLAGFCGLASGAGLLSAPPTSWWPALVFLGLVPIMVLLPLPQAGWLYGLVAAQLRSRRVQVAFWAGLLIAGPVGAVLLVWQQQEDARKLPDSLGQHLAELRENQQILHEIDNACATTDQGRPIRLFAAAGLVSPAPDPELVLQQAELLKNIGLAEHVIRLGLGWQNCNCHGWVFTAGQFWVRSDEVGLILRDNGYQHVALLRPGDLAIYRDPQGAVVHSGVVRYVGGPGLILVESKWGRLGRLLHMYDVHCYDRASCSFYRSRRPGHLVHGLPRPSAGDPLPHFPGGEPKTNPSPRAPHH